MQMIYSDNNEIKKTINWFFAKFNIQISSMIYQEKREKAQINNIKNEKWGDNFKYNKSYEDTAKNFIIY